MALSGVIKYGEYAIFLHCGTATDNYGLTKALKDGGAKPFRLKTATKFVDLGGQYRGVKHPPHVPGCQYHVHVYKRDNELFALNIDGSAHDQSHDVQIPNKVMDGLAEKFPTFQLPPGGRIAALMPKDTTDYAVVEALKKSELDEFLLLDLDDPPKADAAQLA